MSSIQGLYRYGIAGQAASQVWFGMGVQGIGVRGVPGSIPGGTTTFDDVSFKWYRLEREDSEKVLGLMVALNTNRSRDFCQIVTILTILVTSLYRPSIFCNVHLFFLFLVLCSVQPVYSRSLFRNCVANHTSKQYAPCIYPGFCSKFGIGFITITKWPPINLINSAQPASVTLFWITMNWCILIFACRGDTATLQHMSLFTQDRVEQVTCALHIHCIGFLCFVHVHVFYVVQSTIDSLTQSPHQLLKQWPALFSDLTWDHGQCNLSYSLLFLIKCCLSQCKNSYYEGYYWFNLIYQFFIKVISLMSHLESEIDSSI